MIQIKEGKTQKMPGITSLFVSFPYNANIVDTIKQEPTYHYEKKTHTWELPMTSLRNLVDTLCVLDSIDIQLLPNDHKEVSMDVQLNDADYKTKPFDYQLEGIKFGLTHDKWLLLDAPGLGKSLQIIYLAEELKQKDNISHCLIICGINTLKSNWKNEVLKHSKLSCRILGERIKKNGKLYVGSINDRIEDLKNPINEFFVITNIETLRNSSVIKEICNGKNKFDMVVVDEVHKCKSVSAQQTDGLLKLRDIAKYQIAATGTLLLNKPTDAYVPLKWIGMERANNSTFKYYYCNYTGQFHDILIGYRNIDYLKYQLSLCSLRRTKDKLKLPPKNIINEYVDMNNKQQDFYDNIKNGIIKEVDKVEMSTASLLSMITRLRQATACPAILTTEEIESAKIERCCDLIEQIVDNGDKVVVFSTFKETLSEIMKAIEEYKPLLCTGDVSESDIEERKNLFQTNPEHKVLCATWQKMGTGITLTAATYAIFIDTPWTASEYTQVQDRIYRIGTDRPVFIYNLICKGTIDERVLEIVNDKEALSDFVIDDKISQRSIDSLRKYIIDLK